MNEIDKDLLAWAVLPLLVDVHGDVNDMVVQPERSKAGGLVIANEYGGSSLWNPLLDNGDALSLAAKVGIDLTFLSNEVIADVPNASCDRCIEQVWLSGDMLAATRRAIVRAAAKVGEGMP